MKKRVLFRKRSWRFYRNWLIFMMMWATVLVTAALALRASWIAFLLWAVPAYLIGSPIYYGYYLTHPRVNWGMRSLTPGDAGLEYERVEFPSRDGQTLFGWYVPGQRAADDRRPVVVLMHGGGSRGIAMIYHASGLALYGYSCLMFDLRAHGSSDGNTSTAGWREVEDLLGAVDYMQGRDDVDPARIGVLGISLGAQVALRAAAHSQEIGAVVAEGPNPAVLADHGQPNTLLRRLYYPVNWLHYAVLSFMNGQEPPAGILGTVGNISPRPVLLISAGRGSEKRFGRMVHRKAAEPKELWELPDAKHGGAYFYGPEEYAEKVASFFDAALDTSTPPESISARRKR